MAACVLSVSLCDTKTENDFRSAESRTVGRLSVSKENIETEEKQREEEVQENRVCWLHTRTELCRVLQLVKSQKESKELVPKNTTRWVTN